jgi:DNA-binding CsgD family transcriptional regulator
VNGTSDSPGDQIVVMLSIDDPALADRLTVLLADVPGLRVAAADEHGDVVLMDVDERSERASHDPALTPREIEVLTLLAEGVSNKEIARRLGISVHTAKFHVSQVIDKLDATGRTDAVAHAARLGILHL